MQNIPKPPCEAEASVDIPIDVRLLSTAFSNADDELKRWHNSERSKFISDAPNCSDIIRGEFEGTYDEFIAVYKF